MDEIGIDGWWYVAHLHVVPLNFFCCHPPQWMKRCHMLEQYMMFTSVYPFVLRLKNMFDLTNGYGNWMDLSYVDHKKNGQQPATGCTFLTLNIGMEGRHLQTGLFWIYGPCLQLLYFDDTKTQVLKLLLWCSSLSIWLVGWLSCKLASNSSAAGSHTSQDKPTRSSCLASSTQNSHWMHWIRPLWRDYSTWNWIRTYVEIWSIRHLQVNDQRCLSADLLGRQPRKIKVWPIDSCWCACHIIRTIQQLAKCKSLKSENHPVAYRLVA